MTTLVALLRAINVGGTGKIAMADLVKLCQKAGLSDVETYIQSGNVVFRTPMTLTKTQAGVASALEKKLGKPVGVILRKPSELGRVLRDNPFPDAPPNRVIVTFFERAPKGVSVDDAKAREHEELVLAGKELFVFYPTGQGKSKLRVPFAKDGTGRNLNTIAKLAEMGRALGKGG